MELKKSKLATLTTITMVLLLVICLKVMKHGFIVKAEWSGFRESLHHLCSSEHRGVSVGGLGCVTRTAWFTTVFFTLGPLRSSDPFTVLGSEN